MSEETFRIIATVGVALASIAFLVMAGVALVIYGVVKKLQKKVEDVVIPLIGKVQPVVERVGPIMDQARPIIAKVGPVLDEGKRLIVNVGDAVAHSRPAVDQTILVTKDTIAKVGTAIHAATPAIAESKNLIVKVGEAIDQAKPVIGSVHRVIDHTADVIGDVRPRVAEVSDEVVAAVRSGREQVENIGNMLHDATGRTKARLEQIDNSINHTVDQVGNVGGAVKRAVLRPVREANGVAAGVAAAVSTLVNGNKKSSPDSVTQDEEMFI